ncbi:MAG: four helix bundle protein [Planctomycetota bacterium]
MAALRRPAAVLERRDPDLARQLRRAASGVALGISEARLRAGRDRTHLFRIAAGSAAEVGTALALAEAWGHLERASIEEAVDLLDRVRAMLWRLART